VVSNLSAKPQKIYGGKMIRAIKLLGFKKWCEWKLNRLTYKFKQRKYCKAVEVLEDVLERKLDQVRQEPKEKMWQEHVEGLRQAIECVEEDIPYLDPKY
tara:strand:+ start:238 stop:534 length:297 start_codon:yes stop_codon:yes gene_type:complete